SCRAAGKPSIEVDGPFRVRSGLPGRGCRSRYANPDPQPQSQRPRDFAVNMPTRSLPLLLLLACLCGAAHAQPVNGGFETGALTPWTRGTQNQAAVVQSSNFSPGPVAAPGGTRFVALSNGPGQRSSTARNIDGNGTTDYDLTTLQQTFTFTAAVSPARLVFAWNFPTSEQDQPGQFDDVFDVLTTINGVTNRVFSGSSCKNDGSSFSPFPNVPC